ncbi:MAG TPA: zf-HC2 domain-containing protein [Armatimonadota bacterium]|nr:zf-HC2 domain-containing protein [Armatimonadota bacterium]
MDRLGCDAIREMLPDHADGGLPTAEAGEVERHLSACASCRREADEWAALDRVLAQGLRADGPVSDAEIEAAVARVREAKPAWRLAPVPVRFWRSWAPTVALAAAAAVLMAVFGVVPGDTWAEAKQIVTTHATSIIHSYPTDIAQIVPTDIDALRESVSALPESTVAGVTREWDQGATWSQTLGHRIGLLPLAAGAVLLLFINLAFAKSVRGSLRPLQGGH